MATDASQQQQQPREFELRRAEIVGQIGEVDMKSLEQVLAQINTLNRSLEGIIEIGNEFASVEALWSQFETVMGREDNAGAGASSNNTGYDDALGESSAHETLQYYRLPQFDNRLASHVREHAKRLMTACKEPNEEKFATLSKA